MTPFLRACTPIAILITVLLVPGAAQAKGCHVNTGAGAYGPTYTTKLSVAGVSCRDGKGLIRKWDDCRRDNGGRDGRCRRPGHGFRCREHRFNVINTQYDSKTSCRRGDDRVIFRYTQFT